MDDINVVFIYSKHLQVHERLGGPRQYYNFLYLNQYASQKSALKYMASMQKFTGFT